MNDRAANPSSFKWFTAVFLFLAFLFFFRLGDRPLRNPDEGRYAAIAREMALSGDWVTPRLYQIEYLRKPVLFYWLIAAFFRMGGITEWVARSVPAFFGLLGVWVAYRFSRRWGENAALGVALVLGSNLFYLTTSRYLIIDSVFSFFLVLAQFLFFRAFEAGPDDRRSRLRLAAAYAALGAAFLAKGPLSVAWVGLSLGSYAVITRRVRESVSILWKGWWTVLFFAGVAFPWFALILKAQPDFARIFFWHENFGRATSSAFEHQEPWFFYAVLSPVFLLPWSAIAAIWPAYGKVLREEKTGSRPLHFVVTSAVVTVAFLSLSKGKLHTYLLPVMPMLAVWTSCAWQRAEKNEPFWRRMRILSLVFALACVAFVLVTRFVYEPRYAHRYPEEFVRDLEYVGAAALAGCVLVFRSCRRRSAAGAFVGWVVLSALTSLFFFRAMESLNPLYSTKPFAQALRAQEPSPKEEVFLYGQPGAFYDFEFYWGKPVRLVGMEGEFELVSPSSEAARKVSEEPGRFRERLRAGERLYVLSRLSDYESLANELPAPPRILHRDDRKILFYTGGSAS